MSRGPLIRTSKTNSFLSRRTFLRGVLAGSTVGLALPSLDIMLNGNGTAYADGTALPLRFGVWFWGNGVVPSRFVPQNEGPNYTLSESLQPFANVKDYLTVVSGLKFDNGRFHHGGASLILTGAYDTGGSDNFLGGPAGRASIDQVIAQHIAGDTPFKSTQLGIAYSSHKGPSSTLSLDNASWAGAGTPLIAQQDPTALFNRLFMGFTPPAAMAPGPAVLSPQDAARGRVLEAIQADAKRLRTRLGKNDQLRLDEHLAAIQALQKRLMPKERPIAAECKVPGVGPAGSFTDKTKTMNEILRLALACDRTRVFTYMFSSPASHSTYPEININASFHGSVAHQEAPPQNEYAKGVKYFMERMASTLEVLKATPEGAGNLLDSSCVLGTSCIAYQTQGGNHDSYQWPLLVAGRAGGRLKPGHHYKSPTWENASRVPFTCMKAMGMPNADWGVEAGYANAVVPILT